MYLFNCTPNEIIYDACVATKIGEGKTPEEAELECSIQVCGSGVSQIFTEPYCRVKCENTILIEGYYPGHDCNGNYYGEFTTDIGVAPNDFKAQIRLIAELVKENFIFTKTVVNNKNQTSTQTDSFALRTGLVPPYVADKIALCFNAKELYIDDIEYIAGAEFEKNNEQGQMWVVNTQVNKKCSEINFKCE
jgi:hypothetical protein